MSDFLLIVPEGWIEISTLQMADLLLQIAPDAIQSSINDGNVWEIEGALENSGHLYVMQGLSIISARLIQTETGYRLWITLGTR